MNTFRYIALAVALATMLIAGCSSNDDAMAPIDNGDQNPPIEPIALSWVSTQRTPVSEMLTSIDGLGDTRVAVGLGGTIIVRNGNSGWKVIERQGNDALWSVEMIDDKTDLIAGNGGFLRTVDAGTTWKHVGPDVPLHDMSASGKFAIATGTLGILISDDAGATWATPAGVVPPGVLVNPSHNSDQVATAASDASLSLYRTEDAGNNRTEIAIGQPPSVPIDIEFFSLKLGMVALSNASMIFWTDDGGFTWTQGGFFGGSPIAQLEVIAGSTGLVLFRNGQVHKTVNGGQSWTFEFSTPIEVSAVSGIDASNLKNWITIGEFGFVTGTNDAGASWQQVSRGRIGAFRSIAFSSPDIGVAAFSSNLVIDETALRTTDGGTTWTKLDGVIAEPRNVQFAADGVGLLIGGLEVARSSDAGATWQSISPPTAERLRCGAIVDDLTYLVAGDRGTIFRTADAGATWDDVSIQDFNERMRAMALFPGTPTAVVVSECGAFVSDDDDATWTDIEVSAVGVACPNSDVAVAVLQDIKRTADRGNTWATVFTPSLELRAVAFSGEKHGIAVGDCGIMFESLDGGATWAEVTRQTSLRLSTVTFRDDNSAVAAGLAGALLQGTP